MNTPERIIAKQSVAFFFLTPRRVNAGRMKELKDENMDINSYLEERITHLKSVEMEYFNLSCDQSLAWFEKQQYRSFSNEFCGRRKELQDLQRLLNSENTESVSGSSQESGVSHAVRDRNANGEDSPQELEPVAEALEIRTDSEKVLCVDVGLGYRHPKCSPEHCNDCKRKT